MKCNCNNCKYTRKHGGYMPHSNPPPTTEYINIPYKPKFDPIPLYVLLGFIVGFLIGVSL